MTRVQTGSLVAKKLEIRSSPFQADGCAGRSKFSTLDEPALIHATGTNHRQYSYRATSAYISDGPPPIRDLLSATATLRYV